MKITKLEVEGADEKQLKSYFEIFNVLIEKGALDGIQVGCVEIHFHNYEFSALKFNYAPWRRRKE